MFDRAKEFFREQKLKIRLRLKYQLQISNLPPLATHLGCFLIGTLLFEPDSKGKVPSDILVPWSVQKIEGTVQIARDYQLVSKDSRCVLSPLAFRLFHPEEKKVFVIVPKAKQWQEISPLWQKEDTRLMQKDLIRHPPCPKSRSNATIFG